MIPRSADQESSGQPRVTRYLLNVAVWWVTLGSPRGPGCPAHPTWRRAGARRRPCPAVHGRPPSDPRAHPHTEDRAEHGRGTCATDGTRLRRCPILARISATVTVVSVQPAQYGRIGLGSVQLVPQPFLDLGVLPVTGDYAIEFDPQGQVAGSFVALVGQVLDLHREIGLGSPTTVPLTRPGQTATLTVRVPAGVQLSWAATLRGGLVAGDLRLSGPGGLFVDAPLSTGGTFPTGPLAAGEYQVQLDPFDRATGSATLTTTPR